MAATTPSTAGEWASACGSPANALAHPAIQAAASPASHESVVVAQGSTGSTRAPPRARPRTSGIAGSAATLAGTVHIAMYPKWSQTIGAVATLQATATPIQISGCSARG